MRGMMPKSPKARVILAIFVVIFLGLLAFLFLAKKPKNQIDRDTAMRASRQAQIDALNRDSDGDGLKDWEEAIFRTDPHNPDTDGDGTPDGEEVRLGRDPLKPSTAKDPLHPNDLMATSTPLTTGAQTAQHYSPNLTQLLAQSVGQQLIAERLMNPEKQLNPEAIGTNIANNLPAYTPEVPLLTIKDISVTQDDSDAAIKIWARQFDAAVQKSFRGYDRPDQIEPLILINALKDENYESLAQLDGQLRAYDAAVATIEKIPVPALFAPEELQFLRILLQTRDVVFHFRNAEKDPVSALAGIQSYFDLAKETQDWHKKVRDGFMERHITFS